MTTLDIFKRHYTAVAQELVPTLTDGHWKLLRLWNIVYPNDRREPGRTLSSGERSTLQSEMLRRIESMTEVDLETGTGCCADLFRMVFHDPKPDGTFAVHYLMGGIEKVYRALDNHGEQIVFRDTATGEEVVIRERRK